LAFEILDKSVTLNKNLILIHEDANGNETFMQSANWSGFTAGEDGVYVIDIFDGIDMEIMAGRASLKTNFIVKSNLNLPAGNLIIRDDTENELARLSPIYLVRNNQVFQIKDESVNAGFSARFVSIDPQTEEFIIAIATYDDQAIFPISIAENAPRNDWIVLESIVFPGMNMVWIGSILMMFGFFFSIWNRWKTT